MWIGRGKWIRFGIHSRARAGAAGPATCSSRRRKWSRSTSRCWRRPGAGWRRRRGHSSGSHLRGTPPSAAHSGSGDGTDVRQRRAAAPRPPLPEDPLRPRPAPGAPPRPPGRRPPSPRRAARSPWQAAPELLPRPPPGRPVGAPNRPGPAPARPGLLREPRLRARPPLSLSSPSPSSEPSAPRPRPVPTGYLNPSLRPEGEGTGRCLGRSPPWGPPSPSGTRYRSWGTGVRGGVEARLPQPAPRRCHRLRRRPGRCLEPVCGWGAGAGREGRGERPLHCLPPARDPARDRAPARPALFCEARPRLRTPSLARRPANGQLPPGPVTPTLPLRRQGQEGAVCRPRSPSAFEPFPLKVSVFWIGPDWQAPVRWLASRAGRGRRRRSSGLPGARSDGSGRKIWEVA